jgi:hypothetical protein
MGRVLLRGAIAGAIIGLVTSQLLGLVVIGTDDIPDFADQDDLPFLYFLAAIIGVVAGAVVGAAGLAVGRGVAHATTGAASQRRLRGSLAAGAAAGALSLFTVAPFLLGRALVAFVVLALVAGAAAWLLLPGVVDLDTPAASRRDAPGWGEPAADVAPISRGRRTAVTAAAALVGGFFGTQMVMTLLGSVTSWGRGTYDAVSFAVLGVLVVVIGALVWRAAGRARR